MVAVMPPWWSDPVGGIGRWVRAFLSYPQKVPVYYLGHVYDSVRNVPPLAQHDRLDRHDGPDRPTRPGRGGPPGRRPAVGGPYQR